MSKTLLSASLFTLLIAATAHAATLVSSSFVSTLNTRTSVSTTGSNVVDWGYLASGSTAFSTSGTFNFTTLNDANFDATSGIGAVTFARGTVGNVSGDNTRDDLFTFTGGSSPTSGTNIAAGAWLNNFGSTETGAMILNFNNLGLGTHTVSVYVGHKSAQASGDARVFSMDYNWTASDGNVTSTVQSNALGTIVNNDAINSVFQLTVTNTVDAGADLTLTWNSISGVNGTAFFSGYKVETIPVPEPGVALLGGLGALLLLRRRRCN